MVLVVATTAAPHDVVSHDQTEVLNLEPAGEEGTYTQIDDSEIRIVLTEENPNLNAGGVNNDAVTDIGPVFTIENLPGHQRNATVWVSHDSDAVEFYVPDEGVVGSQGDGVLMQPGDSETVAMRIDTRGTDEITLDAITVMAVLDPEVETGTFGSLGTGGSEETDDSGTETESSRDSETGTETTTQTETDSGSGGSGPGSVTPTPTATPTPTPTEEPVDEQAGLEPSSLLWLLGILGGLLLLFALARRRRSEE